MKNSVRQMATQMATIQTEIDIAVDNGTLTDSQFKFKTDRLDNLRSNACDALDRYCSDALRHSRRLGLASKSQLYTQIICKVRYNKPTADELITIISSLFNY
jgi:hypothetical protein